MDYIIRPMEPKDFDEAVELQAVCFPSPFPPCELWTQIDLAQHLNIFPSGQFSVEANGKVIGTCSNIILSEEQWIRHSTWLDLAGNKTLVNHNPQGSTLFGLDISVHPEFRNRGIATKLYQIRIQLASQLRLKRFATACRLPGLSDYPELTPFEFVQKVIQKEITDLPMTAFLNIGMRFVCVAEDFMEDIESRNCNALLEYVI